MGLFAYATLALLGVLLLFLLIRNELLKTSRYEKLLNMEAKILFHAASDPYDHVRRGSIMLYLHGTEPNVRSVVIRQLSFNKTAFTVLSLDKLYFKGSSAEVQLLSAGFRVRRHDLRRLAGKQIHIRIAGRVSSEYGTQTFKARIPYLVEPKAEELPLQDAR